MADVLQAPAMVQRLREIGTEPDTHEGRRTGVRQQEGQSHMSRLNQP